MGALLLLLLFGGFVAAHVMLAGGVVQYYRDGANLAARQSQLAEAETRLTETKSELARLQSEQEQMLLPRIADLQNRIQTAQKQLATYELQTDNALTQLTARESELAQRQQAVNQSEARLQTLNQRITAAESRFDDLQGRRDKMLLDRDTALAAAQAAEDEASQLRTEVRELQAERQSLIEGTREQRDLLATLLIKIEQLPVLEDRYDQLLTETLEVEMDLTPLEEERTRLGVEIKTLEETLAGLKREHESVTPATQAEVDDLTAKRDQLDEQARLLQFKINLITESYKRAIAGYEKNRKNLEKVQDLKHNRIERLDQELAAKQTDLTQLQQQAAAARQETDALTDRSRELTRQLTRQRQALEDEMAELQDQIIRLTARRDQLAAESRQPAPPEE